MLHTLALKTHVSWQWSINRSSLAVSLCVQSLKPFHLNNNSSRCRWAFTKGAPCQVPRTARVEAQANQVLMGPNRFLAQVQGSDDHPKQDCKGQVVHVPYLVAPSNLLQKSDGKIDRGIQVIFQVKIAAIKVTSKRREKKKISKRPKGFPRVASFTIRFTGSIYKMAPSWKWPERHSWQF